MEKFKVKGKEEKSRKEVSLIEQGGEIDLRIDGCTILRITDYKIIVWQYEFKKFVEDSAIHE